MNAKTILKTSAVEPDSDPGIDEVRGKIEAGKRLDFEDGVRLHQSKNLSAIGRLADAVRRQRHGNQAFFVYNQHLNYTNICESRCKFCAFSRDAGQAGAYAYSLKEIQDRLEERIDEPIREIHIVGGLNPDLDLDYYLGMLKTVGSIRPEAAIKAFTAVEIDYIARRAGLGLEQTIARLKDAGLAMTPGGGAEIMSDRIHQKLFPRKIPWTRWLEVMKALHQAGITSNATMLYGHMETIEERILHLIRLRELQDQTAGFSAFIPLAFHSKNTGLSHIPATTAFDDLKTVAVARLMLDNFAHIKAYWVMIGESLAQTALSFGADDLDGTIIEEKISHMAGATSAKGLARSRLKHLIESAGFKPVERDAFYRPVKEAS